MKRLILVSLLVHLVVKSEGIFQVFPDKDGVAAGNYYDDPLFLTPYIDRGEIEDGKQAAKVPLTDQNIVSYSGLLTVNRKFNSNIFFWYFPAEIENGTAPLVVWLQGGPGASSLYGLFEENGPFYVDANNQLVKRDYYWTKNLNVLYIDNPVGTGFSFTNSPAGYSTNQVQVGRNLYIAIRQFLYLFPELKDNELYITGESYAGKYVPAFAYTIDEHNELGDERINLKGIAIGDGMCDPASMLNYGDYLYQIGLIDMNTRREMIKLQDITLNLINLEEYELATDTLRQIILGMESHQKSIFANKTGFSYYYNYMHYKYDNAHGDVDKFVNTDEMRSLLHVGNLTYNNGEKVSQHLKADMTKSIKPWFEKLLEKYRVVLYSGQLDIIIAYPLTLNFIRSLNWSGAEEYKTAERKLWFVDNELAGYTKTVGKFTEVLVRNAGHMVPSDQPKWALDLIHRVTSNVPF
ncbi:venom serine carboxypeptidase-like [Rhodnius prolixus]|uniref:Carboxypeptidase n=2 Tax=Rhodnius prolixus TaxID=13249 RepID=T1IBR1_RHOPR